MQDLCPLCKKTGKKSKLKLLQINMQEAMLACEQEECVWPFGYENLTYFPRKVGKTWSCYWDDNVPRNQTQLNNIAISVKDTEEKSAAASMTGNLVHIATEPANTEIIQQPMCVDKNEVEVIQSNTPESVHAQIINTVSMDNKQANNDLCVTNANSKTAENSLKTSSDKENNATTKKDKSHCDTKDHGKSPQFNNVPHQIGNNIRAVPQITSIEKTNFDISNLLLDCQVSSSQNVKKDNTSELQEKHLLKNKPTISATTDVEIIDLEATNVETVPKSNVNVTTMQVGGVPVTLSYQIPTDKEINKSIVSQSVSPNSTDNSNATKTATLKSIRQSKLQARNIQPIRRLSNGKQYEKFSFSRIKSKLAQNEQKVNESTTKDNGISTHSETNATKTETVTANTNTLHNDADVNSSTSINNTSISLLNTTLDNTLTNTSGYIDTVLDDFLNKDYSISENITDDWIDALLN